MTTTTLDSKPTGADPAADFDTVPELPVPGNPLLESHVPGDFGTPFGAVPFDRIRPEHFPPAFAVGIAQQRAEIEAVRSNPEPPTFENTVVPLERCGLRLRRTRDIFFHLRSCDTNPAIQAMAREVAPRLAKEFDDVLLDPRIYARIEAVWNARGELDLDGEDARLLSETHRDFVRGGAGLDDAGREQLRRIHQELAGLSVRFAENLLAETAEVQIWVDDEAGLDGFPEAMRESAAEAAKAHDAPQGRWLFTLQDPGLGPFLRHAADRELRRRMFEGYIGRGRKAAEDGVDNRAIAARTAALRQRRARLLGYPSHAHYVLENNMAQTPERVEELLQRLWTPALRRAEAEAEDLRERIAAEGADFELEPWDWRYYAEKVRRRKYDLDDAELRPYLPLDRVWAGAFEVARRLLGVRFEPRPELPVWYEGVRAYEVLDGDGSHLGLFYADEFARPSKRAGAWMDDLRPQWIENGVDTRPHVVCVLNLPRPVGGRPALLDLTQVETLFHEFGHVLHGLLTRVRYRSMSGTSVPRDFVELPSQVMENWALARDVIADYAGHHETGAPMPAELVNRIRASSLFNQGFKTVEYLAAAFLDLAWHRLEDDEERDVDGFDAETLGGLGVPREIVVRYRSPYFAHIFSGGYSAGYYSYIWAEVLDADAFEAFKETGDLFDPQLAQRWRDHVLERGFTVPPDQLYRQFRGADPKIEPLLERRGLA
ncbi:MAG: M3 family metallopeptidase [Acidobacteriota bacterium]